MTNNIWYCDDFDFFKILCPYKHENEVKKNPPAKYHKHEFLFLEEDPASEIFLIDFGKVKIGRYDYEGNEFVIAILGRGEILGQMALLSESRHHIFAEVMEEGTQVCRMSVEKARELTRDYVPFSLEINRRISGHIHKLERRIEVLLFKDVKIRLVELLKDMAKEFGRQRDSGIYISHNLTQSDIASLIGTSRKSASLILNELEDDGLIEFDRKHIFISSLENLANAAPHRKSVAA